MRPIDRPVVAADDGFCFQITYEPRRHGGTEVFFSKFRSKGVSEPPGLRGPYVTKIEHVRTRNWRPLNPGPNYRCFPFGSGGREEPEHRPGQRVAQRAVRLFEERLPALQRVEHREHGEDRILRAPWLWCRAQHEVFEWRRAERVQSRIHAIRIGLEDRPVRLVGAMQRALCDIAEAMHAHLLIDVHRAWADEAGQLARGLASLQIHLKKAILRVQEPERTSDVFARAPADRRDAQRVTIDADVRRQARDRRGAVELREAGADLRSGVDAAADGQHHESDQQDQDAAGHQPGHCRNSDTDSSSTQPIRLKVGHHPRQ